MQCAICSSERSTGSRFCTDCRRALRRARDETVSQLQLGPAMALAAPRAFRIDFGAASYYRPSKPRRATRKAIVSVPGSAATSVADAAADSAAATRAAHRTVWAIVAVMVIIGSVMAFYVLRAAITHERESVAALQGEEPAVASRASAQQPGEASAPGSAAHDPAAILAGGDDGTTSGEGAADGNLPTPPQPAELHAEPVAPAPRPVVHVPRPRPAPVHAVQTSPVPAAPAEPVPESVVAARMPAPAAREAPRTQDRWQAMQGAMARCGRENFLARLVCEQRVRLKYCEGQWGEVPQCPGAPVNDHGQ